MSIFAHKRRSLLLKRRFIDTITFKKRSYTSHNDKWGTGEDSFISYTIKGLIVAGFPDFEEYMPFGVLPHTDIIMYTFPDFDYDNQTITVALQDRIIYDDIEYEIKKIHKQRHFHIKAVICQCRRVNENVI